MSIGVVGEDGREFYAVSTEFDPTRAGAWVRSNVLPKLPSPGDPAWRSRARIRADLLAFLTEPGDDVELWAWIAAYDHVAAVPAVGRDAGAAAARCPGSPGSCGSAGRTPVARRCRRRPRTRTTRWPTPG